MRFWEKALEKLQKGQHLVLMIVVKSEGSSPGKAGFKMMVANDGTIWGSIGGGAMEHRLTEECRKMLNKQTTSVTIKKQDHQPLSKTNRSGMICSGLQWVAFYPLHNKHINLIKDIIEIEEKKLNLLVSYEESGITISEPELYFDYPVSIVKQPIWQFAEQPGIKNILYIFGAGHVSLALSKLAKDIDFEVVVFDNRNNINTFDENIFADSKQIINYAEAANYVKEGKHIYIAIMTFAHQSDLIVLEQMIAKKVKYIGMMGSPLKVETIFDEIRRKGIKGFSEVDAPIGISINSITPAEIAVSIMAKIIKVKNG